MPGFAPTFSHLPSAISHVGYSDFGDVAGLRALRAVNDFELHCLALFKRAEAVALNGRVVHEDVAASVTLDEPIPLGVVEPLDLACNTHRSVPTCCDALRRSAPRARRGTKKRDPKKKAAFVRPFPYGARPARRRSDNTELCPPCQERC